MSYNFLYEKLYVTLYILFIVLTIISTVQIVLQSVLILSPSMRARWVKWSLDVNCSALEIQKIVGYPQYVMFSAMVDHMVDHKLVSRIIKRIIYVRKEKDYDDVVKYMY